MAARALSSATISFGLVSVPVQLFTTNQSSASVSFHLLHKKDHGRLKQQYVCQKDGELVPRDDMVKGYEFAKDQYVVFTPEELKALEETPNETVEIKEFVPSAQVERIYLEKAYYLGPDKGGDRAYHLLAEALRQTGRVAVGKYAARGRQYLVMVRPIDGGLVMEQLRYAQEVKPFSEVPVGEANVKAPELKLAVQLIEQAATDTFTPQAYEDEAQGRVREQIAKKVEGQQISAAPAPQPQAKIIDLMDALKQSLAQGAERKPPKRAERVAAEDGEAPAAAATKPKKKARKVS
jgi:DNA end-binding protein Ku